MENKNTVPLNELGFYEIQALFNDGIIGTKEFRNWLALSNDAFSEIRDADIDREIEHLAASRQRQIEEMHRRAVEQTDDPNETA